MTRFIFDVETNDLLPGLHTIHSLVIRHADNPDDVISCADQPGHVSIAEGVSILESADQVIGHNIINFDDPAITKLHPLFQIPKMLDTLVCSRLMFPEIGASDYLRKGFPAKLIGSHSLKAWGYRLGVYKGDFGENADWSQWTPAMQRYCVQDTLVTSKLLELIHSMKWSQTSVDLEHDFALYIRGQETNGFGFNEEGGARLYAELCGIRNRLHEELTDSFPPKIEYLKTCAYYVDPETGTQYARKGDAAAKVRQRLVPGPLREKHIPFNPSSRLQAAERLIAAGWEPDEFTEGGRAKVDDETLGRCKLPQAPKLAQYFLLDKRIGQLSEGGSGWLRVVKDGKIHGSVITNGAVTGRCTHKGPNVAQTPRVITRKVDGREEILWGEEGGWASDMRALWGPTRPGWVQVGADAAGLELRCLAHYLTPFDGGRYAKIVVEADVHVANRETFGLSPDKEGRNRAKTAIYCLIYGGGDEALGMALVELEPDHEIASRSQTVPAWALKSMAKHGPVNQERVRNWKRGRYARDRMLKGLDGYAELVAKVTATVEQRKWLKGIDGRRLTIRKKHAALNTLLQNAGAMLVKNGTVIMSNMLEDNGLDVGVDWAPMAHIHDEVQIEACDVPVATEVGRSFVEGVKEAGRRFGFTCPLDGEFKVGKNWADTH